MGKSRLRGSHRTIQAIKQRETYIRTRKGNINLNETADALVVKGERFEAVFSKKEGTLSAYTLNNVPLMSKGLELNLFRAPTDNDKQVSGDWQRKGLYQLQTETGKWETRQEEDRITLHIRNCHKGKLGFEYRTEMEYTVNADGSIMVNSVIMPVSDAKSFRAWAIGWNCPKASSVCAGMDVAHGKTTQTARTPLQ